MLLGEGFMTTATNFTFTRRALAGLGLGLRLETELLRLERRPELEIRVVLERLD